MFQLRERRSRFGELIQIDGSPHAWFEGRGPRCTLIVFIDDATSRLTALRFVPVESTRAYLEALRDQVLRHGRPLAFHSNRHGIFRVNAKDAQSGDGRTEFGRVAERLGIEPIHALTPPAKGRVERANQTLQDRMVKEMRLRNICSIEAANEFSPTFIASRDGKFAVPPRDEASAHRPWITTPEALDDALARREERVLTKALTFSSSGTKYCVRDRWAGHGAARGDGDVASPRGGRDDRPLQGPDPPGHGVWNPSGPPIRRRTRRPSTRGLTGSWGRWPGRRPGRKFWRHRRGG